MDFNVYFQKNERSYRLMKAGQVFFSRVFTGGVILFIAALILYGIGSSRTVLTAGVLVVLASAGIAAGREWRRVKSFEPSLYLDRCFKAGDRFPALYQLVKNGSDSWACAVLKDDCETILRNETYPPYPVFQGKGKFVLLPLLAISAFFVISSGDDNDENSTGTLFGGFTQTSPGPESGGDLDSVPDGVTGIVPQDNGNAQGVLSVNGRLTEKEINTITALLETKEFREIMKSVLNSEKQNSLEAEKTIVADTLKGKTDSLNKLLTLVEELTGGSGKGAGAGLTDSIRDALTRDDFERAAAEFRHFLALLRKGEYKDVTLSIRGKILSYQRSRGEFATGSRSGDHAYTILNTGRAIDDVPIRYRDLIERYFNPQN